MKRLLIFSFVFLLFAGCKKQYPDDRWQHLRCPEKRLFSHPWFYHKYKFLVPINYEFGLHFIDDQVTFNEDGTCSENIHLGLPNEMIYLYDFNGTWELIENDTKIKITYKKNPSMNKVWTIQQLDRKYMVIFCDSIRYDFTKDSY